MCFDLNFIKFKDELLGKSGTVLLIQYECLAFTNDCHTEKGLQVFFIQSNGLCWKEYTLAFGTSIVSSALINPGNTVTSTNLFTDLIYSSFTAPIKLNILNVFWTGFVFPKKG